MFKNKKSEGIIHSVIFSEEKLSQKTWTNEILARLFLPHNITQVGKKWHMKTISPGCKEQTREKNSAE